MEPIKTSAEKRTTPPPKIMSSVYAVVIGPTSGDCGFAIDLETHDGNAVTLKARTRGRLRAALRYFRTLDRGLIEQLIPSGLPSQVRLPSSAKRRAKKTERHRSIAGRQPTITKAKKVPSPRSKRHEAQAPPAISVAFAKRMQQMTEEQLKHYVKNASKECRALAELILKMRRERRQRRDSPEATGCSSPWAGEATDDWRSHGC